MTKHPRITASNYKEVYDYYRTPRTKRRFSDALFSLSEQLYAPDTHCEPATVEAIKQQLDLGKGALLAMNHPSAHDPFVMAGTFHEIEQEIPGFGDFMGFGKDSLFRSPTRPVFENTGCVPVFRRDTYPDIDPRVFAALTNELFDVAVDRLKQGRHVSLMPEGTRSHHDQLEQLQYAAIKTGIARIALLATDEHSFIVPVGIHYRNERPGSLFVPRGTAVVYGDPITEYASTTSGIRQQILEGMQHSLSAATVLAKTPR